MPCPFKPDPDQVLPGRPADPVTPVRRGRPTILMHLPRASTHKLNAAVAWPAFLTG